jgi:quinol monooxygenase YgiN
MKSILSVLLAGLALLSTGCLGPGSIEKAAANSGRMIIAKVNIKPDKVTDFVSAAKEIIAKSNQEAGCVFYQLYQDPYDHAKFVFVEEYKNQTAVDFHFATEYFKSFGSKIGDMISSPTDIRVINVTETRK